MVSVPAAASTPQSIPAAETVRVMVAAIGLAFTEVSVRASNGRCHAQVSDTGVGLQHGRSAGLGTGLSSLRERLRLTFGEEARLTLTAISPHGTCADLDIPAWPTTS